ncbi:MAG: hypothetical protein WCF36_08500 [Candidatus Nanopelagicales bacterium]
MDEGDWTVTSVNGNRGSSQGKIQAKRTATSSPMVTRLIKTRMSTGPGRWFQIQEYI